MIHALAPDEDLVRSLPLPLAQLYRRACDAKTPLDRHLAAFYLWEASLKLLASVAVAAYTEKGEPAPELAERLRNLARPALGHWWEFVRLLVPVLADSGNEGFRPARDLVFGRQRDDLPRAAGLDAALREELDGAGGVRVSIRLSELFDRLVRYRNREIGHGATGQRPREYYDRMGRSLLLGTAELLGRLDVLAGRRLITVTDVRRLASGHWLIERYELAGRDARPLESLERPESEAYRLPLPGWLYLDPPTEPSPSGAGPSPASAWPLHPLVLYDHETAEVFFLNARRGQRRTEYLCYHSGRTVERQDLGVERRALLARVLGGTVDDGQIEQWAANSQAEEPKAPEPEGPEGHRLGEFELLSELGRGGMGVVYRAWQPSLGRLVALKCLLRVGDRNAEARFNREIHALGRVEHPHLVKVFTSGAEADRCFYAMELIEGATLGAVCGRLRGRGSTVTELDLETWRETLGTACQEARAAERPLRADAPGEAHTSRPRADVPPPSSASVRSYVRHVAELVRQVAEAAHALNEAGVIHRDIKPENILVTPDGAQAVLMDLGLAQLADEAEGRLTRTRQFAGTLRDASPEQVLSVPLDRRTDVYSLGATLWELLTLRPLFGATDQTPTPALMLTIQHTDPDRPRRLNPTVPEDLEAVVLKCLEKDRARRYATSRDLADDLSRWLRGDPVQAQPPTLRYLLGKSLRRHRVGLALTSALVLAALLGTFATLATSAALRIDRARRAEAKARREAELARDGALRAREGETLARRLEADARRLVEGLKEALRLRLVQKVDVGNGVRLQDQGDLFSSLAWFADALQLEQDDPERGSGHSIRILATLSHCPKLTQVLFHDGLVSHAAFSPDGRRVVTAGGDRTARVWDAAAGQPATPPMRHDGWVNYAGFSPDGRRVVTASGDRTARVWDAATGQPAAPPMRHESSVWHAAFSPDGRRVVTASDDGTARVWDAATGQPATPPMRHGGRVDHAAFSPDGRRVVTASVDGTARVWDAATGQPAAPPLKHGGHVSRATFSPDGRRVVTAGGEFGEAGEARVWDAATGQPAAPPLKHDDWVRHAAFSPDGRRVVTASGDRTARVWDTATGLPAGALLEHRGADLIPLAQLLSGSRVDPSGELVPLTSDEFRAKWQNLRDRYPEVFLCSPEEIRAWHWREATGCENSGAWAAAIGHLDALIEAEPDQWMLRRRRGQADVQLGRWDEALVDYSQALALRPDPDALWRHERLWDLRGSVYAELGRWEEAVADFSKACEQDIRDGWARMDLAISRLAGGHIEGYRQACASLLRDFGRTDDPGLAVGASWTCALVPDAVEDREAVVRLTRKALDVEEEKPKSHVLLQILGAATYRAGRFEEALGYLNDAMRAIPGWDEPELKIDPTAYGGLSLEPAPGADALDWLFLAMAHYRLGHAKGARTWLDKAVAVIDEALKDPPKGNASVPRIDWRTRLAYRALRREAESLVNGDGSPSK